MKKNIKIVLGIFAVQNGKINILLKKNEEEPYKGYWLLPSTVYNDSINNSVDKLISNIGIEPNYISNYKTFETETDLIISVYAFTSILDGINNYILFDIDCLPKMISDENILANDMFKHLKKELRYVDVLRKLFIHDFSLSELQSVYEQVFSKELDRRNFRKRLIAFDIIEKTGCDNYSSQKGRPAMLYNFKENISDDVYF